MAVCESLTAIFYIVVHLLYIASEDPCNHSEAMYFYAHFRRKGGHNEKSINPEKRLCKRTDKDIAEAITFLTETERKHLYHVLGSERIAEIFSYFDDAEMYLEELSLEQAAKVISYMDADDALDVLDDLSESKKNEIVSHLDADAQKDVQKLLSYEEDEIGSCMTNNFVCISEGSDERAGPPGGGT